MGSTLAALVITDLRHRDELLISSAGYMVADAVQNWLEYGLSGRDLATGEKCKILAQKHVIGCLGARKLVELTADEVDGRLADRAKVLSTRSTRSLSVPSPELRRATR
ncbi:hypothetical protein GCM10009555_065540 [Acrocarpospora macrocephala]|uniref:Uncharacterized protein n=1 Tax=Acrocarpospora macrocephala TaxID=150177 RepID=A0A5M3WYS5_9ACTN|nr:hypothetical protein [Acrocarpospora macrocephala]GES13462.1 hypothetical protein Amac_070590 [Acrocarpospora macrocephala]